MMYWDIYANSARVDILGVDDGFAFYFLRVSDASIRAAARPFQLSR
jgi:hypothetical protein